jgi:hypothetical protein
MEILQAPESRRMAAAYRDGHITFRELMQELEWCWDKKI